MSAESTKALAERGAAPLNFIYACSLCCATFADVYEGHSDSVQGLSDGINPKERLVTKLYLATCCHVLCSSHLEGGGPPFHPEGQRPKAPCPVCIKEKDDREVRELYSVRGFNKDEYDPQIPPSWFTAPPFRLDGNGKEMEALRFQYIALIRYCQNIHATRKRMQNALVEAENNLIRMQNLASAEYAKVLSLQQENQQLRRKQTTLEVLEDQVQQSQAEIEQYRSLDVNPRDLETFRVNKTAIRHYLKLVPILLEQNEKMKQRLASLGSAMALKPVPNFRGLNPNAFDSDETLPESDAGDFGVLARKTASSQTTGRSAHTSGGATTLSSGPSKQRPLKRQRQESPHSGEMKYIHPTSRDTMPPPPKPSSRMQSVRKLIPIIRRKYSQQGLTSSIEDVNRSSCDISMVHHENGNWQNIPFGYQALSNGMHGETPYMSGALPVDEHRGVLRPDDFQLSSLVDIQQNISDLKSRKAYPVKTMERVNDHEAVQLPTKPSCIYLTNGLSQHNEVELELKDPRQEDTRGYNGAQARIQYTNNHSKWQLPEMPKKKRFWNIGQPFLSQSPQKASTRLYSQVDPMDHAGLMDASGYAENDQISDDPTLSGPRRYQQSPHQVERVVSPFFKGSLREARLQPVSGLAEPQDSSNLSGTFQSQGSRMTMGRTDWREPPFFDSPVNTRNQVIQQPYIYNPIESYPSSQHGANRSVNEQGFITRPDKAHSLCLGNHDRSRNSQHASTLTQPATKHPCYKTTSSFYTRRPYPGKSPMASSRSPVRVRSQWESLHCTGVRSSRQSFHRTIGYADTGPPRNIVSDSGRRSVRR